METYETPEALAEKLEEVLVNGPLYVPIRYLGSGCHAVVKLRARGGGILEQNEQHIGYMPEIKKYCNNDRCKKEQNWKIRGTTFTDAKIELSPGIQTSEYKCRNCDEDTQIYWYIWSAGPPHSFNKIGQYPPLTIEPSPAIAAALGSEDAALYKKGLIDYNFGHGLGAVAYMRRIVENKINDLLDLIVESERLAGHDDRADEVEAVKKDRVVQNRIDLAKDMLPDHLKPGGHNPLEKLYGPLSAGHHGESDEECLTTFGQAQFAFEYLFKRLGESNEDAKKYNKWISDPKKK